MDLLKLKILKFRTVEEITSLAQNLFAKDKQILEEFLRIQSYHRNRLDKAAESRHSILTTVEKIVSGKFPRNTSVPNCIENYLAFCDLHYVLTHSNEKEWFTFSLKGYQEGLHDIDSDRHIPVKNIRKSLKKALLSQDPTSAASIQCDYRLSEGDHGDEVVFYRMVSVPGVSNRKKDVIVKRLCSKNPTFFAYFPGESYIYADTKEPEAAYLQAWLTILRCTGYSYRPLHGHNVEGIRRMRAIRDKNENVLSQEVCEADNTPILQDLEVTALDGDKTLCLDFHGGNVLGALKLFHKHGLFSNPVPPAWAQSVDLKGRNSIKVTKNGDFDNASIAHSDLSVL